MASLRSFPLFYPHVHGKFICFDHYLSDHVVRYWKFRSKKAAVDFEVNTQLRRVLHYSILVQRREGLGPPMVSWLIDSSQFMTSHVSEPIYLLFASMPSRDLPTMLCVLCWYDDQIPMLLAVRFFWHLKCGSGSLEMKSNSNIFLVNEFYKTLKGKLEYRFWKTPVLSNITHIF